MDATEVLDVLALSGLSDDDFARVSAVVRAQFARADAGARLAEVVLAHESYQPAVVMSAVGRYFLAPTLDLAAA